MKVGIDRGANGGIEIRGTEVLEDLEAFQFVFDRILHSGEAQLDSHARKDCSSLSSMSAEVTSILVTGSAATMIRFTGLGELADGFEYTLVKQLRVGEEKRRVPAEQHQSR